MRTYADTSFIVKLLVLHDAASDAIDLYRSIGRPPLYFTCLHRLEVGNAIRQRAFHQRRSEPALERAAAAREREEALSRMVKFLTRKALTDVSVDLEAAIVRAQTLSEEHTEKIGCRGFDLLHVAMALELNSELFLSTDENQITLARSAGLPVKYSAWE